MIQEEGMENKTKERILEEALVSFADKGYKGTNLRDLAAQLGLSKSALYRHYDSKEAIWNATIDMMESYYDKRFGSPDNMPEVPDSCDELLELTLKMINFTIHDPKVILTRRVLLTEQFHDERARNLATLHFLTGTQNIYKNIFEKMIEKGLLKNNDPEMLAFAYTSPITSLIHLCDREPEKESEAVKQIEEFIKHFISTYKK